MVLVHVPEVGVNVISIPTNYSDKANIKTPITKNAMIVKGKKVWLALIWHPL
jgi:hypothetical protein